jgi:hypothetical protein
VPSLLGLPPPVGPTPLTTEEVSRLANLAGVPDANRHNFSDLIVHELTELHIRQRKEGPRSDALKKAVASLRSARQALQDMTQEEMRYFAFADANDPHIQLGIAIDTFLHIADGGALTVFGLSPMPFPSRRGGSKRPRGRPLGTRINPAQRTSARNTMICQRNARRARVAAARGQQRAHKGVSWWIGRQRVGAGRSEGRGCLCVK